MFKIFGFGRAKNGAQQGKPLHEPSTTTRQHSDIQRELVRVVLKETLTAHGIPGNWLTCEVTALTGRARGDDILVRLIVLTWHEPLLKFLPALQQQLIQGLDRFEPSIDHSKYVVSWQFAPDCGCPHRQMPDAKTWGLDSKPAAPSIVNWEPNTKTASAVPAVAVPLPAQSAAAPIKPKFELSDSGQVHERPVFVATEPATLTEAPKPKPKFDLPPSPLDALPSNFAPTEPGSFR